MGPHRLLTHPSMPDTHPPRGRYEKGTKPIICLRLERSPNEFVFRTILPLFSLVMLPLISFYCERDQNLRFSAIVTSALSIVANVEGSFTRPNVSYMLAVDAYIFFVFQARARPLPHALSHTPSPIPLSPIPPHALSRAPSLARPPSHAPSLSHALSSAVPYLLRL